MSPTIVLILGFTGYRILRSGMSDRLKRVAALLIPLCVWWGIVFGVTALNFCKYGVFCISEFKQKDFLEALEALSRVKPKLERKRRRFILKGDPPSPSNPPSGCVFHTRCPLTVEACITTTPEFRELRPEHFVACHLTGTEDGSKIPEKTILASETS